VLQLLNRASVAAQSLPRLAQLCTGTLRFHDQRVVCSKKKDKNDSIGRGFSCQPNPMPQFPIS